LLYAAQRLKLGPSGLHLKKENKIKTLRFSAIMTHALIHVCMLHACIVCLSYCVNTAQKHERHDDLYMILLGCKQIHTEATSPKAAEKYFSHQLKVSFQKHTSSTSKDTKSIYSLVTVP
jgi:hypothetical protein